MFRVVNVTAHKGIVEFRLFENGEVFTVAADISNFPELLKINNYDERMSEPYEIIDNVYVFWPRINFKVDVRRVIEMQTRMNNKIIQTLTKWIYIAEQLEEDYQYDKSKQTGDYSIYEKDIIGNHAKRWGSIL